MDDDHELAATLATTVANALVDLQREARAAGKRGWRLEDEADASAQQIIAEELRRHRPDDAVLSEEAVDDAARLDADRVWIVDPVDGTNGFGAGDGDWAVHVALTEQGQPTAAAVSVPALDETFSTAGTIAVAATDRPPIVVCGRSRVWLDGQPIAHALGGPLRVCGSAGVKAMMVVSGAADVYVHAGPMYEWDVCAPVAVAEAAGLVACTPGGERFVFNQRRPVVPGLIVARRELAEIVGSLL